MGKIHIISEDEQTRKLTFTSSTEDMDFNNHDIWFEDQMILYVEGTVNASEYNSDSNHLTVTELISRFDRSGCRNCGHKLLGTKLMIDRTNPDACLLKITAPCQTPNGVFRNTTIDVPSGKLCITNGYLLKEEEPNFDINNIQGYIEYSNWLNARNIGFVQFPDGWCTLIQNEKLQDLVVGYLHDHDDNEVIPDGWAKLQGWEDEYRIQIADLDTYNRTVSEEQLEFNVPPLILDVEPGTYSITDFTTLSRSLRKQNMKNYMRMSLVKRIKV